MMLALGMAVLAGAAQAKPAPRAGEGEVLVYIFRSSALLNSGRAASFYIDESKVADLRIGGCVVAELPAGDHRLIQIWKPLPLWDIGSEFTEKVKPIGVSGDWQAGQTYYYELDVLGNAYEFGWRLSQQTGLPKGKAPGKCRLVLAKDFGPKVTLPPMARTGGSARQMPNSPTD